MAESGPILPPLDDRGGERYRVEGDVVLRILWTPSDSEEMREIRGRVVDAGSGGLCVAPEDDIEDVELDEGVLADLDLQLEGAPAATSLGLVRWAHPEKGIGIEFFYGSEAERDRIREYVLQWVERHEAEPLPGPGEDEGA